MQKDLVQILKGLGYKYIYENLEYHVFNEKTGTWKHGEIDVLASRDAYWWNDYEIKSGKGKILRATNQIRRAKEVVDYLPIPYNIAHFRGVYVGKNGIKRVYL